MKLKPIQIVPAIFERKDYLIFLPDEILENPYDNSQFIFPMSEEDKTSIGLFDYDLGKLADDWVFRIGVLKRLVPAKPIRINITEKSKTFLDTTFQYDLLDKTLSIPLKLIEAYVLTLEYEIGFHIEESQKQHFSRSSLFSNVLDGANKLFLYLIETDPKYDQLKDLLIPSEDEIAPPETLYAVLEDLSLRKMAITDCLNIIKHANLTEIISSEEYFQANQYIEELKDYFQDLLDKLTLKAIDANLSDEEFSNQFMAMFGKQ